MKRTGYLYEKICAYENIETAVMKASLGKRNRRYVRRRFERIASKATLTYHDACAAVSYWGWLKRSDSYRFYNHVLKSTLNIRDAKRRIKTYASYKGAHTQTIWSAG